MPAMPSLKKLAIRGTIWTLAGYGGSQLLRLGGNVILTRLLVPEMFGLMALVSTFITALVQFSDLGVLPSIIRSPRWNDPTLINTAWTLQVMRGFGLWLASFVIAWPVAQFYGEPQLFWILPVIGSTQVMDGFASTSPALLNRQLELGKLTRYRFGIQVIGLTIMIVWAYWRQTIWALLGGMLISSFVQMIWSHRLVPDLPSRFTWNKEAFKEIFSFGKWVFLSTMMFFLASQSDRLILGKLFSLKMLGVYTVAFTLSEVPRQLIIMISQQVIFPLVSQQTHLSRPQLHAKLIQKRRLILIGFAFLVAILTSFGDLIILGLYDRRYADGAWMFSLLAIGIWPTVLTYPMSSFLNALGTPQYLATGNLFRFLFIILLLPYGFHQLGALGAIIVIALNDLPTYGVIIYGLWREKLLCLVQDFQATLLWLGLLVIFLAIRVEMGLKLPITGFF